MEESEENKWLEKEEEADKPSQKVEKKEAEDTEELEVFRRQWQEELKHVNSLNSHYQHLNHEQKEAEAAGLYWRGVAAERSGDTHSALAYYRKAVQLVPDIEYKLHSKDTPRHLREVDSSSDKEEEEMKGEGGVEIASGMVGQKESTMSLVDSFNHMTLNTSFCTPERLTKVTHISSLPCEVVRLILLWVVSAQLDMRALEQCSMVCRGFYCLARQPDLWKMACQKLWPKSTLSSPFYGSWREMYLHRPHLYFHGVYISKISYVRRGERSLDGYYKPYHTVVYYRYLRFFPNGVVMYQTSPDDPASVVGRLRNKHSSEAVLLGEYSLDGSGSKVVVDVLGYQTRLVSHRQRGREKREITHEQRFHLELTVKKSKKSQIFNQLIWEEHYCHSLHRPSGSVQLSHFTLDYKYPPFLFSRVKSFTASSHSYLT